MESLILTVSSFLIGGTILFFYAKSRYAPKDQSQKVNELVEEIKVLKDKNTELVIKSAKAEEKVENMKTAYADLKSSITSMGDSYKIEFKNVANELLDQKSKTLEETSNKNIKTLLEPLNKDLIDFRKKVEKVYDDEARERHSLEGQVKKLVETSTQVSQQAENLTNALKGNVKQQGNWG